MAKLGDVVIYTVSERERAKTVRDNQTMLGSNFHAELMDFAGLVGRVSNGGDESNASETYDIVLLIPQSPNVRWVRSVTEGSGPGTFKVVK